MKNKYKSILIIFLAFILLNGCGHLEETKQGEYPEFIANLEVDDKTIPIDINLDYTDLYEIVPIFSYCLKFNYIIQFSTSFRPISVMIKAEYTKEEVWALFVKILENCNASYTVERALVTISPNKNETDEHVVKLTQTENDKDITITEAGPPDKKPNSPTPRKVSREKTPEEMKKIRQAILKKMMARKKANPDKLKKSPEQVKQISPEIFKKLLEQKEKNPNEAASDSAPPRN